MWILRVKCICPLCGKQCWKGSFIKSVVLTRNFTSENICFLTSPLVHGSGREYLDVQRDRKLFSSSSSPNTSLQFRAKYLYICKTISVILKVLKSPTDLPGGAVVNRSLQGHGAGSDAVEDHDQMSEIEWCLQVEKYFNVLLWLNSFRLPPSVTVDKRWIYHVHWRMSSNIASVSLSIVHATICCRVKVFLYNVFPAPAWYLHRPSCSQITDVTMAHPSGAIGGGDGEQWKDDKEN